MVDNMDECLSAYRALALSVIEQAKRDFEAPLPPKETTSRNQMLGAMAARIEAGMFLLERVDPIVLHWFTVASIARSRFTRDPRMVGRLRVLKRDYKAGFGKRPAA